MASRAVQSLVASSKSLIDEISVYVESLIGCRTSDQLEHGLVTCVCVEYSKRLDIFPYYLRFRFSVTVTGKSSRAFMYKGVSPRTEAFANTMARSQGLELVIESRGIGIKGLNAYYEEK